MNNRTMNAEALESTPLDILRSEVLAAYAVDEAARVEELRVGHINRSFRVRSDSDDLIVQRINSHVFKEPEALMNNFVRVTRHIRRGLENEGKQAIDRHSLSLRRTSDDRPYWIDREGELWRAVPFIPGTITRRVARDASMTREAGRAYGRFQQLLADFDPDQLVEPIPRFHDTPWRYGTLDRAIEEDVAGRLRQAEGEVAEAMGHRERASLLLDLVETRQVPMRIAHNDAKLTNVLLDKVTELPLVVIDLDTVMPGLSLFDFGDMARSMSHRTTEDETDLSRVVVDTELFVALAAGYLETAIHLTTVERNHLVDAAQVLILEQAVRYLTDYLDGDRYFRVAHEQQNLYRARTHLALLASLQEQEHELKRELKGL